MNRRPGEGKDVFPRPPDCLWVSSDLCKLHSWYLSKEKTGEGLGKEEPGPQDPTPPFPSPLPPHPLHIPTAYIQQAVEQLVPDKKWYLSHAARAAAV